MIMADHPRPATDMMKPTRYFVAKCLNMNSLKLCQKSLKWACRKRNYPPQTNDVLTEAFNNSDEVILIFSVNNCHGWHGYATMETAPGDGCQASEINQGENESEKSVSKQSALEGEWFPFKIKWKKLFFDEFGEQCLSSDETIDLLTCDPQICVNNARNFDELPSDVGHNICQLIQRQYSTLVEKRDKKEQEKLNLRPDTFLKDSEASLSVEQIWKVVLEKVEKLGTLLLACPFGSQRYNLDTEGSDTDMFVIYAAHTHSILGFNPPAHTIKNQDKEKCDYTILEIHRYCELLLAGDPRCVETLFLDPSTVYYESEDFAKLCKFRKSFLTKECMEKYTRDALGARGMRQIEKIQDGSSKKGAHKLNKMFYIVLRLLQNARNIAKSEDLVVFRPQDSQQRALLMSVRNGDYSYQQMKAFADELIADIQSSSITENKLDKQFLEHWLLDIRHRNFMSSYTPSYTE